MNRECAKFEFWKSESEIEIIRDPPGIRISHSSGIDQFITQFINTEKKTRPGYLSRKGFRPSESAHNKSGMMNPHRTHWYLWVAMEMEMKPPIEIEMRGSNSEMWKWQADKSDTEMQN